MAGVIREFIMVKDDYGHAKLEDVGFHLFQGHLQYTDDIYNMLNDVFKMDRLINEVSYVISFDHAKQPKGICKIGHGDADGAPLPIRSVFIFLLLTGANSFVIVHNHVSGQPDPSEEDKVVSLHACAGALALGIDFVGHMIINPNGYIIDNGQLDGTCRMRDIDGEIYDCSLEDMDESISECEDEENTDIF